MRKVHLVGEACPGCNVFQRKRGAPQQVAGGGDAHVRQSTHGTLAPRLFEGAREVAAVQPGCPREVIQAQRSLEIFPHETFYSHHQVEALAGAEPVELEEHALAEQVEHPFAAGLFVWRRVEHPHELVAQPAQAVVLHEPGHFPGTDVARPRQTDYLKGLLGAADRPVHEPFGINDGVMRVRFQSPLRRRDAQAAFEHKEEFVQVFVHMPDVLPVRIGATQVTLIYSNTVGAEQGHEVNPRHVFYRTGQADDVVSQQVPATMKFTSAWGQENLP